MKHLFHSLLLTSSLALAQLQNGQQIAVDFGTAIPASGNYNIINSSTLSVPNLIKVSDAATSGVSLSVTATNPFDNAGNIASTSGVTTLNTTDADVYGDGFLSANGNNGAGTDVITLTFTGLNDALSYDLSGGLSRSSGQANFSTTWSISGVTDQNADGTAGNGHVSFTGLNTSSGSLVITLTDNTRQSGLAQLTLTAVPKVGSPPTTVTNDIPCILDIERDPTGDVILTLDRDADRYVVEQSEDLTRYFSVKSTVEAGNTQQLRISATDLTSSTSIEKEFFRVSRKPNFIIFFTDDQGYQDLSVQGHPTIQTPRIDQMAAEGIRFTDFYAQAVCGPSRDALLTGCYPLRTAYNPLIHNGNSDRENPHPRLELSEITIAEILKAQGYATEAYGKWDLEGRFQWATPATHYPESQGFDAYYETSPNTTDTTQVDTDNVISFIQNNKTNPFFAYVAYNMPHEELHTSAAFTGITGNGIYDDVMAEVDHSVGRVLDTLTAEGLDELTYVFFMSDNGPWYLGNDPRFINKYGSSANAEAQGGSALPLRGDKVTSWEGGFRVPCIMRAPGRIPAGQVTDALSATLDIMPTIAKLAGSSAPTDRVIDGHDISPILHGHPGAVSPRDSFFFYVRETLHAVRVGKWKMHVPHAPDTFWERFYRTGDYITITSPLLYDLDADIGETTDVSAANPSVVADLMNYINFARNDIGDGTTIGVNARSN